MQTPPTSGKGSGLDVWQAYARSVGLDPPDTARRMDIIDMVRSRRTAGGNRQALETSITALAVRPEHAALVEAARSLAEVVDVAWAFDDRAWREYRMALAALMEATANADSDAFAELMGMLTAVGDTPDT